jgi:hypothetical protein
MHHRHADLWPVRRERIGSVLRLRPVSALRLQEDDRIRIVDGQAKQSVRVDGIRGHDDFQACGVRVVRLRALAVVLLPLDPAERGDTDHDRHRDPASGPQPVLRDVADDLIERGVAEPVELHLGDRTPPSQRQTDADPGNAGFGDRCVEHALPTELLLQTFGDPEYASELPDVLAEHERSRVALEGVAERGVERHDHRYLSHRRAKSRVAVPAFAAEQ